MPAVGDDQLRLVALDEVGECVGDRRAGRARRGSGSEPCASAASSKTGASRSSFSWNFCARGCSLIPRAPRVEAACRLPDRVLVQVEPDERDEPPVGARREGERAVVRGAEGRVAVGLVEAEHERAGDPVPLLAGDQLVEVAEPPVDVGAEMDVRVEDLEVLRKLVADELLEALDECLRARRTSSTVLSLRTGSAQSAWRS